MRFWGLRGERALRNGASFAPLCCIVHPLSVENYCRIVLAEVKGICKITPPLSRTRSRTPSRIRLAHGLRSDRARAGLAIEQKAGGPIDICPEGPSVLALELR